MKFHKNDYLGNKERLKISTLLYRGPRSQGCPKALFLNRIHAKRQAFSCIVYRIVIYKVINTIAKLTLEIEVRPDGRSRLAISTHHLEEGQSLRHHDEAARHSCRRHAILALLHSSLISDPDFGAWPSCWFSAEFLRPFSIGRGRVTPPPS